jgi:HK97 family phage major capsid protein
MAMDGISEAKASGIEIRGRGVMVSGKALQSAQSRDLSATGGTDGNKGGMTIPTQKLGLLDSLMHGNPIAQLGGTVLTNLVGNFDLPRIIDGADPAKKTENAQADEYDPTVDQVSFAPNRLPTVIEVSTQLMIQGNESALMAFLQNHLRRKLAQLMGKAFINGNGVNEAEGILQTSGIGAVVGGANGLAPAWTHIVGLETAVANDDALEGNLSYLTNSKVVGKLKVTPKVSGTDSRMILEDRENATLNNHNWLSSNAVPSNLTKGSGTSLSAMIFGNFIDYYQAQWSGIEFLVNPYSKDDQGLVRINASIFYDGHVVRPESFAAMADIITV